MEEKRKKGWLRTLFAAACAALLCAGALGLMAGCSQSSSNESKDTQNTEQAAENGTRTFTDSAGREVEIPAQIDRIVPSGHTANQVLLTMAPEKMVGLSQDLSDKQKKYFEGRVPDGLPVLGAAFGAKGDLNKEAVAATGAQILIDTGEYKDGIKEDLDNLQQQLGIPCVFIETPLDDWASAYEKLGDLLGMKDRGQELADYCKAAYDETSSVMATIPESERVNMAYLMGDAGLNAIAKGSYQGTVIDMCANNVVQVEKASGTGQGNEISLEQIAVWNPDVIVFATKSIYGSVSSDPAWAGISAVENGQVYEVPSEPWSWLNNPPTVNQVLGMQWLPRLLYPSKFDNDLETVVKSYYKTFYGYDLSDQEYNDLTAKAQPKTA